MALRQRLTFLVIPTILAFAGCGASASIAPPAGSSSPPAAGASQAATASTGTGAGSTAPSIGPSAAPTSSPSTTVIIPAPSPSTASGAVPPMPITKFASISKTTNADGSETDVDRITWTEPAGVATEFRLYGVTKCLNESAKTDGQKCLVAHMTLPAGTLKLIQTVSGTTRSITMTHVVPQGECGNDLWCTTGYFALVLGAYNAYGHSVFAIPVSSEVCYQCVY